MVEDVKAGRDEAPTETLALRREQSPGWGKREAAPPGVSSLEDGDLVSRSGERHYRVAELLGRGGMGEVHLALDEHLGRGVALKVLLDDDDPSDESRGRFFREARLQGKLEHPGVVPVYDLDSDASGRAFFVMKRVAGVTLGTVVRGLAMGDPEFVEKYPTRRLLAAFLQVCLAVDYAHKRGVVHRDLKLSNVMLGDFGEVYVLDWGIAKVVAPEDPPRDTITQDLPLTEGTRQDVVLGTLGYMAPEQILDASSVDARADVYSLGAILFSLVTLQQLHRGRDRIEIAHDTTQGVDARPSTRAPHLGIAPELDTICTRATEVDPARRYSSARALHDAVQRWLEGDRDLRLRQELSDQHLDAARRAMSAEFGGGEGSADARREALQQSARALALQPESEEAAAFLSTLMLTPLKEMPMEVQRETEEMREQELSRQAGMGAVAIIAGLTCTIAMLVWIGVRSWVAVATLAGSVSASAFFVWLLSRGWLERFVARALAVVCICVGVAATSRIAGPLWLPPLFGMAVVAGMSVTPALGRWRTAGLVGILLSVLGPWLLEFYGVLEPHYLFRDGVLTIGPDMVSMSPARAEIALALAACGLILQVHGLLSYFSADQGERQLQTRVMTWQLRQAASHDAPKRAPLDGVPPSAPWAGDPKALDESLPTEEDVTRIGSRRRQDDPE